MRRFAACGHPVTPDNILKNGGGTIRCKSCRDAWKIKSGRKLREPVAKVPDPMPCCIECGKERPDRRPSATGLCRECFAKVQSHYLKRDSQPEVADMRMAVVMGSQTLIAALRREHPAIVAMLSKKNPVRLRKAA